MKLNLSILSVSALALSPAISSAQESGSASTSTVAVQEAFATKLDFNDKTDFDDARKGLIAEFADGVIRDTAGKVVWDMKSYAFENSEKAPPTVNPSLWRQERLNNIAGLFKVTEGIYQVRGLDLSNMTIIEGKSGLIVVDPLVSMETASAAMALYRKYVGQRPVKAVIYSHSHVDHYGGVKGVVSEADVVAGKVKVYAPHGFLEVVMDL